MRNVNLSRYAGTKCGGTGECAECYGSGVNVHLNSEDNECPSCHGTRKCVERAATGRGAARPSRN